MIPSKHNKLVQWVPKGMTIDNLHAAEGWYWTDDDYKLRGPLPTEAAALEQQKLYDKFLTEG